MNLHKVGRALFGCYFIYSGINHFVHEKELARYAKAKHVPAPDAAVIASGIALVAGGAAMALGVKPKLAAAPIVGFLAAVSPAIHSFWKEKDGMERQQDMAHFGKNLALLTGTLAIAGAGSRR